MIPLLLYTTWEESRRTEIYEETASKNIYDSKSNYLLQKAGMINLFVKSFGRQIDWSSD